MDSTVQEGTQQMKFYTADTNNLSRSLNICSVYILGQVYFLSD